MRILLIDNYDSFTYNVYQYLLELGHSVEVIRNDKITLEDISSKMPEVIFISPGPGTPSEAGICIPIIQKFAGIIPIFGICLGHQAIGEAFGGKIVHAKTLMHGKTSNIISKGKGIMKYFKEQITATRYHSLVIEKDSLPECLEITCESDDGEIMGVRHKELPIEGVQFHPESIMTIKGKEMLKLFLDGLNTEKDKDISAKVAADYLKDKKEIWGKDGDKLIIEQSVRHINVEQDAFSIFQKLQARYGGNSCFLLESASGPEIDCTRTTIGLFPQLTIEVNRSNMKVNSDNPMLMAALKNILQKEYEYENDIYFIKEDKFSKIFQKISDSVQINKLHNEYLTLSCGFCGYFSYEYLHYIETVPRKENNILGLPEVQLKYFPILLQMDYNNGNLLIVENRIKGEEAIGIQNIINYLCESINKQVVERKYIKEPIMKSNISKDEYIEGVKKAKQYIFEGDIFQVQLGQRITIYEDLPPLGIYENLKRINPSPYMFYWDTDEFQLIGDSPELQLRVDNGEIMIRPIAGTSKGKGTDEKSRREILDKFTQDSKENAEHIMLVDLARNDIGCKAEAGSVHVSQLMQVEEFSHVFHLTSTVIGKLKSEYKPMEVFEATFPAGTLTGAPKIRAMEIISELEKEVRGPYGGAFGFFDFQGNIVSSIIIRTIVRKDDKLYIQASAGIVADSSPEAEWEETLHKMKAVKQAILE